MAKIFSRPKSKIKSPAEVRVLEILEHLSDDWIVLHSVPWHESSGLKRDGETDFFVLHSVKGILLLEVKGGGISIEKGLWFSTDRHGKKHLINNPYTQVSAAKATLHKWLKDQVRINISTRCAVVLADKSKFSSLGPASSKDNTITAKELSSKAILSALNRAYGIQKKPKSLSKGQINKVIQAIAPTLEIPVTLSDEARYAKNRLDELTKRQEPILNRTRRNSRQIIYGSAGTGKTALACAKARQIRDKGKRVLLTCYGNPLAEYLKRDPTLDGITVSTFHAICRSSAKQAKIDIPELGNIRKWLEEDAADVLFDAVDETTFRHFDAVIVIEERDFGKDWILALESTCVQDSTFYIFSDPKKARDHNLFSKRHIEFDLDVSCRNTDPIAKRVAKAIESTLAKENGGISGPEPKWTDLRKSDGVLSSIQKIVGELLSEGFEPAEIVVLCETQELTNKVRALTVDQTTFCKYGEQGVAAETTDDFRGLESMAVVVVLEHPKPKDPRDTAYTAFGRAISCLRVLAPPARKKAINWN